MNKAESEFKICSFGKTLKEIKKHRKKLIEYNGLKKYKDKISSSERQITFYLGRLLGIVERCEILQEKFS